MAMSFSGGRKPLPALPAGFRFHPTDEELIVHYLMNQAAGVPCPVPIIAEVNIYACNPWDLPAKAVFGEKEWYFFSPRERKYPNGARPNRAAGSGYWKATGTDKAVLSSPTTTGGAVGVKKALVFYSGKPPRGAKTDWIMHEYRLITAADPKKRRSGSSSSSSMRLDDWVLCRIYKKGNDFLQLSVSDDQEEQDGGSTVEEQALSPKPDRSPADDDVVADHHHHHQFLDGTASMMSKSCSLTDLLNTIDGYSALSQLLLDGSSSAAAAPEPEPQLIYDDPAPPRQEPLHYNSSSAINMLPRVDASSSDYYSARGKRKRMIMATTDGDVSCSFDDGSGGSTKKMHLLPSDPRIGGIASSYCIQQQQQQQQQQMLLVDTSGGSQYGGGLMTTSHPFLNHQLLLSNHLRLQ